MTSKNPNRWFVAIMATLLMVVLGTVYAWSFFQSIIVEAYGWSQSSVAWAFSTSIVCLGLAAAWAGIYLPRRSPTGYAVLGALLYGSGYLLSALAFSLESLPLLIFGFGVVGGTGLGLGYVTPVVTAAAWFPDKKGLITGMVIMGFGFGALVMSTIIAPQALRIAAGDLVAAFGYMGGLLLVVGLCAALCIKQPPGGAASDISPAPPGYGAFAQPAAAADAPSGAFVFTGKFLGMWLILFINVTAGIMFISFQSPLMQDILGRYDPALDAAALAAAGAALIALSSLCNGVGRLFWGGLSDRTGRIQTFRLILGSQVIVFILLLFVDNPYLFGALVCYVLLCYGGGFGTMPAFVADVFGNKRMPVVYGSLLTAWSLAGIAGPQIVALLKDRFQDAPADAASYSFIIGAVVLSIGFCISLVVGDTPSADAAASGKDGRRS